MKTILTGLLSKAYNYDNGKIAELFKDGEELTEDKQKEILNEILEADKNRVENIKKSVDTKEVFQDGYKKAKSEVLADFEKGLKDKFAFESSKIGVDLVEEIISSKSEKGKGGALDENAIKASKVYQDLESKMKTDILNISTEKQKEIDDLKNGFNYEKTFSNVQTEALKILNSMNPVLSANKTVADNQVNTLINSLKDFKFDVQDSRIVVMDQSGKVVEDGHGNSKSFNDIVKENANNFFDFKKNNGGSGAGNGGAGTETKWSGEVPKTVEELEKLQADKSISAADRYNMAVEFEKAQKGIE